MSSRSETARAGLLAGAALLGILGGGGPAFAQTAQTAPEEDEVVVITGYRASLARALDVKRNSVSAVDAIVAEDIAKFPDQNLAESLQRIPGISIQRDGGEGRAITVRGLGSQFTRVRVNGLETVATATDGASSNRDRAFDFNVFASELFTSLVVHKTAEASLDEGSLGAVVDLNTGNPLGGKVGVTFAASATGSYNDLSETWGPRLASLLSFKSSDGVWGASVSAAYSQADTLQLGNNTVRWAQARFDSVNGTPCFTTPNSGGAYVASADCDRAALAFHPRIPRYGEIAHDRERLGITGSFQLRPTDKTEISIDGLFSRFEEVRSEKWGEVLLRSNERSIDVANFAVDGANNMVSATLNDAWVRTEAYRRETKTDFFQISSKIDQQITDSFKLNFLVGASESDADIPIESTIVFDDRDAQNYSFDYTDSRSPRLTFGTSVTDPANFQLAEIRDRPSNVTNRFSTVQLNGTWDATEWMTVKGGGLWRQFEFKTEAFSRDTVVCGNGGVDRIFGTLTCTPSSNIGPTAVYGFAATSALSELFTLGDAGQPSGTTVQWLIPNLDAAAAYTGLYSRTAAVDAGNTRGVTETVTGGYLQADFDTSIGPVDVKANVGARYVNTDQDSRGLNNGLEVTVNRSYDDWLPAFNLAVFPVENLIVRASAAKVITRPTLGNLTPGGTVDGFNYRVSFGNPNLDPFRATAYDLAVEYYFAPQSIISLALFAKDVESFPVSQTRSGTFASTGLPLSVIAPSSPAAVNPEGQIWTINTIGNGEGATLEGLELSVQTPFSFLPGLLSNFGALANVTFVDSDADYRVSGPSIVPGGPNIAATRTSTLFGLSKEAYNATLYYEGDKFSARTSVSYRSDFVDANSGTGNVFEGYNESINVDASARYKISDSVEFSIEGINLTDDYRDRYTDVDANRNYEYNHFGRTILVGVRYKK